MTVEIAVNPHGLGAALMTAEQALRPELMLAFLVWVGVVGFALNQGLLFAEARLFGAERRDEALAWRLASSPFAALIARLGGDRGAELSAGVPAQAPRGRGTR